MSEQEWRTPLSAAFERIRENLHFVLVGTETPANIGSSARAMKANGFHKMILVNPLDLRDPEIEWLAHRSMEVVKQARVCTSLDDALNGMRLTVATTMRQRHFSFPFFSMQQIAEKLMPVALDHPVAIVFGRESTGLTNEELLKCQLHSSIPTATQNPALNLAQAVLLYAHTFFSQMNEVETGYEFELASRDELENYYEHLLRAIKLVDFVPRDGYEQFITRFRRMLSRAMAEQRDVRLLHKLLSIFEKRIDDLQSGRPLTPTR